MRVAGPFSQNLSSSRSPGFSEDFQRFLTERGYGEYDFAQSDAPGFGGRIHPDQEISRDPVIFIHGNSDTAKGWRSVIDKFKADGYSDAELYALSYGPGNPALSALQHHSKDDLQDVRKFIEAVLEYTGAEKVDVISHSLGVTLTRKALKGGEGLDPYAGQYDLGDPLTDQVDAFVGIAGANQGLSNTRGFGSFLPTGNRVSGLHPDSDFLRNLNNNPTREAQRVYSIGGRFDQILGRDAGRTNHIPGEDDAIEGPWGHFGARSFTAEHQIRLVQKGDWPKAKTSTESPTSRFFRKSDKK
ncbi:MAG: lipase [Myxococcota bacterium]